MHCCNNLTRMSISFNDQGPISEDVLRDYIQGILPNEQADHSQVDSIF